MYGPSQVVNYRDGVNMHRMRPLEVVTVHARSGYHFKYYHEGGALSTV